MAFSFGLTGFGSSLQKTLSSSRPQERATILNTIDEAFGLKIASENKIGNVAQEKFDAMFEKAKATQTYGFADSLKFRVVIPFKNLFGKASAAEKEELELYHMHQELHKSVETVQKAYKNYLPAEQAVTEATPDTLISARIQEKNKATALIISYKDLIALAVKQAEELSKKAGIQSGRSDYLLDAQAALNEGIEAQGAIFYTVHMLTTREVVRGPDYEQGFTTLVNNYNRLEGKALSELGRIPTEREARLFKAAFIEGLAALPGVKASDVATYESCLTLPETREAYYAEMFNHFISEMDIIIQSNKSAKEVLPGTQYHGVNLPLSDELIERLDQAAARLQQLKKLEAQRDALIRESQETEATIESLKTPTKYTVQEFADFVGSSKDLGGLRTKIEAGAGRFAEVKELETIQKQIAELEQQSAIDIAEFKLNISGKEQRFAQLNDEFSRKAAEEKTYEREIKTLTATLNALRKDRAQLNDKINSLTVSTTELELLEQMKIAGQNALAAREKTYTDTIAKLQVELTALRQDLEQRGDAIVTLKREIDFDKACAVEFNNTGSPRVKDELQRLRTARDTLSGTSREISGDELLEIAMSLLISGEREGNLGAALANAQKVSRLKEAQATRNSKSDQVGRSIDAAQKNLPQGIAYKEGTLKVVPEEIFTPEQVIQMNEAVDEQLDVAVEVSQNVHDGILARRTQLLQQAVNKTNKVGVMVGLTGLEAEVVNETMQNALRTNLDLVKAGAPESEDDSRSVASLEDDSASESNALGMPIAKAPVGQLPVVTEVLNFDEA
jgi:hypothetical protein